MQKQNNVVEVEGKEVVVPENAFICDHDLLYDYDKLNTWAFNFHTNARPKCEAKKEKFVMYRPQNASLSSINFHDSRYCGPPVKMIKIEKPDVL